MKYEYQKHYNSAINDIINKFDEQIKKEYTYANGDKEKCISYWHKQLFLKTLDFDLNDWKKIRSGDYWEKRDSKQGIEQLKFIYERVTQYLG